MAGASPLRVIIWAGPLTIAAAVGAVLAVQRLAVALLAAPPAFLQGYAEPAAITAVLVTIGIAVFAGVCREASRPAETFRLVAFAALLVSLLPDLAVGAGWLFQHEGWTLAAVFMTQHVAAWAVTSWLLPRLVLRQ